MGVPSVFFFPGERSYCREREELYCGIAPFYMPLRSVLVYAPTCSPTTVEDEELAITKIGVALRFVNS